MSSRLEVPKELLARHASSAPRYTSYPTAVDGQEDPEKAFSPEDYGDRLRSGINFDQTFAMELKELEPIAADGLVLLKPELIELTNIGQVLMRNVAVPFDRYMRERKSKGGSTKDTFSKTL